MKNKNESDYLTDYADFESASNGVRAPSSVSFKIRDQIKAELQPDLKTVFLQLTLLHALAGGLTLLICPQFGIGPLGGGDGLVAFVEDYGHVACGLFCGSFFVSLTTFLSWVFLRKEIQRAMKQNQFVVYPFLGILSFATLTTFSYMVNGALPHMHQEFLLPWFAAFCLVPILMNAFRRKTVIIEG